MAHCLPTMIASLYFTGYQRLSHNPDPESQLPVTGNHPSAYHNHYNVSANNETNDGQSNSRSATPDRAPEEKRRKKVKFTPFCFWF